MAASTALTGAEDITEVAFITESNGQSGCICAWNFDTGVHYKSYKNGSCAKHGFAYCNDYLLAAQPDQALIHLWSKSKEQLHAKISCSGKISALACSHDGSYCVAAIAEKIYVWQLSSGNLLSVLSRHYQTIRCVRFVDDSSYFISGGDDGLIIAWRLADVITEGKQFDSNKKLKAPAYVWSDHSLPITCIYCGYGGNNSRIATTSKDQNCKLWDLARGQLLYSFVFNSIVFAVTMDSMEANLYVGTSKGRIFRIDLYSKFTQVQQYVDESQYPFTEGHSDTVNCLTVSMSGNLILSGSADNTVKVWHASTFQCLKVNQFKGAITNLFVTIAPYTITKSIDTKKQCLVPYKQFKRYLHDPMASTTSHISTTQDTRLSTHDIVETLIHERQEPNKLLKAKDLVFASTAEKEQLQRQLVKDAMIDVLGLTKDDGVSQEKGESTVIQMREKIDKLEQINKSFYLYAINELLDNK